MNDSCARKTIDLVYFKAGIVLDSFRSVRGGIAAVTDRPRNQRAHGRDAARGAAVLN
jgi:hypothetical protein